jgi:hypothetical protein
MPTTPSEGGHSTGAARPQGWLKWYNLAPADEPVPEEIEQRARTFLVAQSAAGELRFDGELGFVILHRCGKAFFLQSARTRRDRQHYLEDTFRGTV